jgi:hypothetical protein
LKVDDLVSPFTLDVMVTDRPEWSASTRFCTVSCEHERSPSCVEICCTTAGPWASSCCTKVVTWASFSIPPAPGVGVVCVVVLPATLLEELLLVLVLGVVVVVDDMPGLLLVPVLDVPDWVPNVLVDEFIEPDVLVEPEVLVDGDVVVDGEVVVEVEGAIAPELG